MKPTIKRLQGHTRVYEAKAIVVVEKEKEEAVHEFVCNWWENQDPNNEKLHACYQADKKYSQAKNELIDLTNEKNIYTYHLYYKDKSQSFNQFKKLFFLEHIDERYIHGFRELKNKYNNQIDEIARNWNAVRTNLSTMKVKEGMEYLESLGINVELFKEVEALPPMVVVDVSKLGIEKESGASE